MDRRQAVEVLNRLLCTLYRSLPMYLTGRRAWAGTESLRQELAGLVADYRYYVERICRLIYQWDGRIEPGQFPLDFTSINDLSLDWLWPRLIEHQQRDIASIQRCVEQLASQPSARALAEEVLGNARGHLKTLQEFADRSQVVT